MEIIINRLQEGITCALTGAQPKKNLFACNNGVRVHADAEKTQQILLNLLSNAIKFTEPGEVLQR